MFLFSKPNIPNEDQILSSCNHSVVKYQRCLESPFCNCLILKLKSVQTILNGSSKVGATFNHRTILT